MELLSATVTMLIRRPPAQVCDAFVKPERLREFWLAEASAPLAAAAQVTWQFMVPGASEQVNVTRFEPPERIEFDWSDGIHVAMRFEAVPTDATRVCISVEGVGGDDAIGQLTGAVEGFSIVLCDLKTLLETGRSANLVRDKAELITRAQQA